MAELTTAIPQLSQLPQCIVSNLLLLPCPDSDSVVKQLPAYGALAAAGCGPDLACICGNDNFFLTVEGVLLTGACTPLDAEGKRR